MQLKSFNGARLYAKVMGGGSAPKKATITAGDRRHPAMGAQVAMATDTFTAMFGSVPAKLSEQQRVTGVVTTYSGETGLYAVQVRCAGRVRRHLCSVAP